MRAVTALLVLAATLWACTAPNARPLLAEGTWTGALTPMNHPEMANAVRYTVSYPGGALAINLIGPGGMAMATRALSVGGDTLRFTFDEPEERVPLRCALARQAGGTFAGRCTDAAGQWARFTMVPPSASAVSRR